MIHPRLSLEDSQSTIEAGLYLSRREGFRHQPLRSLRLVGGPAIAIHVKGERSIAQLCQLASASAGVFVVPPPFVNDNDAGDLVFALWQRNEALERRSIDAVLHVTLFDTSRLS